LSGLKWVKIEKDARAQENGDYIFRREGMSNMLVNGVRKGARMFSALATHYAGPVVVSEPDPELQLPEGWEDADPLGYVHPNTNVDTVRVWKGSTETQWGIWITVTCPDRARRILAVNAAVKALEDPGA
jgi:hypothetical protein